LSKVARQRGRHAPVRTLGDLLAGRHGRVSRAGRLGRLVRVELVVAVAGESLGLGHFGLELGLLVLEVSLLSEDHLLLLLALVGGCPVRRWWPSPRRHHPLDSTAGLAHHLLPWLLHHPWRLLVLRRHPRLIRSHGRLLSLDLPIQRLPGLAWRTLRSGRHGPDSAHLSGHHPELLRQEFVGVAVAQTELLHRLLERGRVGASAIRAGDLLRRWSAGLVVVAWCDGVGEVRAAVDGTLGRVSLHLPWSWPLSWAWLLLVSWLTLGVLLLELSWLLWRAHRAVLPHHWPSARRRRSSAHSGPRSLSILPSSDLHSLPSWSAPHRPLRLPRPARAGQAGRSALLHELLLNLLLLEDVILRTRSRPMRGQLGVLAERRWRARLLPCWVGERAGKEERGLVRVGGELDKHGRLLLADSLERKEKGRSRCQLRDGCLVLCAQPTTHISVTLGEQVAVSILLVPRDEHIPEHRPPPTHTPHTHKRRHRQHQRTK